jgi:hypothetical protein
MMTLSYQDFMMLYESLAKNTKELALLFVVTNVLMKQDMSDGYLDCCNPKRVLWLTF